LPGKNLSIAKTGERVRKAAVMSVKDVRTHS
jgi:hypothetical protein